MVNRWFAAVFAAAALLLQGCGGGGDGGNTTPPPPARTASMAGVYGNTEVSVIADGAGRLMGAAVKSGPSFTHTLYFSGTAAVRDDRTWEMRDARVFVDLFQVDASAVRFSTVTTITGTFERGASVSFVLPSPPRPESMPAAWTAPANAEGRVQASIAAAVGRYVLSAGSPRDPRLQSDLTVDASGGVAGRFNFDCFIEATLSVVDPAATVITAQGSLSGAGCPAGSGGVRTFLGSIGAPTAYQLGLFSLSTSLDSGEPISGGGFKQ